MPGNLIRSMGSLALREELVGPCALGSLKDASRVDFTEFLGWGLDVTFIIIIDTTRGIRHGIGRAPFLCQQGILY